MSELLRNPEVLAKATEELDRVIGRDRLVAEEDIPNLPYMEAHREGDHAPAPSRATPDAAAGSGGRVRGQLRHPGRHARLHQRLGHRPRPGGGKLAWSSARSASSGAAWT